MKLKTAILSGLGRDSLGPIVDALGLDAGDRRSAKMMRAVLLRSRRASAAALLEFLSEQEVKQICASLGLPSRGRRAALVQSLLSPGVADMQTPRATDEPSQENGMVGEEKNAPGAPERNRST